MYSGALGAVVRPLLGKTPDIIEALAEHLALVEHVSPIDFASEHPGDTDDVTKTQRDLVASSCIELARVIETLLDAHRKVWGPAADARISLCIRDACAKIAEMCPSNKSRPAIVPHVYHETISFFFAAFASSIYHADLLCSHMVEPDSPLCTCFVGLLGSKARGFCGTDWVRLKDNTAWFRDSPEFRSLVRACFAKSPHCEGGVFSPRTFPVVSGRAHEYWILPPDMASILELYIMSARHTPPRRRMATLRKQMKPALYDRDEGFFVEGYDNPNCADSVKMTCAKVFDLFK